MLAEITEMKYAFTFINHSRSMACSTFLTVKLETLKVVCKIGRVYTQDKVE